MSNIFPKSANKLPLQIIIYLVVLASLATAGVTYYMTPKYTRVGYAPLQPVPFSHALHAGQLGMDCRYCLSNVDKSGHSNVPTAQTCMNCHSQIKPNSPLLAPVRESYETGKPVPWVWIHQTPDYAYFNHSAHVNRGVSCVECHGRIDQMDVVKHEKPLSMGFCLDCHRAPELHVREPGDVFNLASKTIAQNSGADAGKKFVHEWNIRPPQSCSGCHR
ncbi:MAG: cytochrome c3 family protein [Opitutaceae bacterium]